MSRIAARRRVTRLALGQGSERRADFLAVEEPLEIRVDGEALSVTMRTPGHDVELAVGFLLSEGLIRRGDDVLTARYCAGATADEGNTYNVLDLQFAPGVSAPGPQADRAFTMTSACGVCGKTSIDAIRTRSIYPVENDPLAIDAEALLAFPDALRAEQAAFDRTGGLHAAAVFDGVTGELLAAREDVGRHNAVDKVLGWAALRDRLPLTSCVLMVSGRASFELTQKALMAGIPLLAAVSAPSSLAADLAEDAGLTLAGFVRGERMVVYTRPDRIVDPSAPSGDRHADHTMKAGIR